MSTSITIDPAVAEHDYNRASADHDRGSWQHAVVLADDGRVYVDTIYGGGMPMAVWHGRHQALCRVPDGTADVSPLLEYLSTPRTRARLAEILKCLTVEWDGSNHRGRLDEHGVDLLVWLCDDLQGVCDRLPCYWTAADYLLDSDPLDAVHLSRDPDGVARLVSDALVYDDVYLDADDAAKYLAHVREHNCTECGEHHDDCVCDEGVSHD
jgi:hypothetical protein